jgi:hypothetical protein
MAFENIGDLSNHWAKISGRHWAKLMTNAIGSLGTPIIGKMLNACRHFAFLVDVIGHAHHFE